MTGRAGGLVDEMDQPQPESAAARLVAGWQEVVDKWRELFPQENWAHFVEDDGRWVIVEKGLTPHGWRELSQAEPFFRIQFAEPFQAGDRLVVGEEIYEFETNGTFRKLDG